MKANICEGLCCNAKPKGSICLMYKVSRYCILALHGTGLQCKSKLYLMAYLKTSRRNFLLGRLTVTAVCLCITVYILFVVHILHSPVTNILIFIFQTTLLNPCIAGIDFRRQILVSKVYPCTEHAERSSKIIMAADP